VLFSLPQHGKKGTTYMLPVDEESTCTQVDNAATHGWVSGALFFEEFADPYLARQSISPTLGIVP